MPFDTVPVSFWRWSLYKISNGVNYVAEYLHELAFDLEHRALYGRARADMRIDADDEIPF